MSASPAGGGASSLVVGTTNVGPTSPPVKYPISSIKIGEHTRKELGNIDKLAASIAVVGLLHPVVVDGDRKLIAGRRRLEAIKQLGWSEVPVTVVTNLTDALAALQAECDENTCREALLPSEAVAMAARLEPLERKRAKERQLTGKHAEPSGKLPGGGQSRNVTKGRRYQAKRAVARAKSMRVRALGE